MQILILPSPFLKLYNLFLFPSSLLWQHTVSCFKDGVTDKNYEALEGLGHTGIKGRTTSQGAEAISVV